MTETQTANIAQSIKALNTSYLVTLKDGQMTEQAWDELVNHLNMVVSVIEVLQESQSL